MTRYRLTGAGAPPGFSAQWERRDDDREIARRVLNVVGDRRLLWVDMRYEIPEECMRSAAATRERLTDLFNRPEIGPDLERQLQGVQRALREFMTTTRGHHRDWPRWSHIGPDEFSVELGRLRALVGLAVGTLAAEYDLEVPDELVAIVPDQAAWVLRAVSWECGPAMTAMTVTGATSDVETL